MPVAVSGVELPAASGQADVEWTVLTATLEESGRLGAGRIERRLEGRRAALSAGICPHWRLDSAPSKCWRA